MNFFFDALSNLMSLLSPFIPLIIDPTTLLKADYFIFPPFSSAITNRTAQIFTYQIRQPPHSPTCISLELSVSVKYFFPLYILTATSLISCFLPQYNSVLISYYTVLLEKCLSSGTCSPDFTIVTFP